MTDHPDAWGDPIRRPEGPAPERKILLTIRLTEDQFEMASEAAARAGLSLTEYAKDRLVAAEDEELEGVVRMRVTLDEGKRTPLDDVLGE